MALGSIIRRRRDELNLSQGRVAFLAGLSQGYLSKLENDSVKSPSIGSLYSLAAVLFLDPHRLLDEAGYGSPARLPHFLQEAAQNIAFWTSWQTLPPCLGTGSGWVCRACRHWPAQHRLAAPPDPGAWRRRTPSLIRR